MDSSGESRLDKFLLIGGALLAILILFFPLAYFVWMILTMPD